MLYYISLATNAKECFFTMRLYKLICFGLWEVFSSNSIDKLIGVLGIVLLRVFRYAIVILSPWELSLGILDLIIGF